MAFSALPHGSGTRYPHSLANRDRHSGSAHVRHGKPRSAATAATVDHAAAAYGTADHRQAEYFVRLLAQSLQLVDHRINKHRRAIAVSEAGGDVNNVRALRRVMSVEEKDRRVLLEMIDHLERRFRFRPPVFGR